MTILEKIKEMNKARGWSIYELCRRANIAEATLYSCMRRERNPSNEVLEKICRAYGITLFQFYHDLDGNSDLTEEQKELIVINSLLEEDEKEEWKNIGKFFISKRNRNK